MGDVLKPTTRGIDADGKVLDREALRALDPGERKAAIGRWNVRGRAFEKGRSGNPAGRPKGRVSLTAALKRRLSRDPETMRALVDAWIERALGEGGARDLSMLLDRVDGAVVRTAVVESLHHVKRYGFEQPPLPPGDGARVVEAVARAVGDSADSAGDGDQGGTTPAQVETVSTVCAADGPVEGELSSVEAPPGVGGDDQPPGHAPRNADGPPGGTIQGTPHGPAPKPRPKVSEEEAERLHHNLATCVQSFLKGDGPPRGLKRKPKGGSQEGSE